MVNVYGVYGEHESKKGFLLFSAPNFHHFYITHSFIIKNIINSSLYRFSDN